MKLKVDIDTKTFVRFWLVIIGFALAALLIYNARTALTLVGAAVFLAIALSKPVAWLSNKLPGESKLAATSVAFLIVIILMGLLGVLVVPPIVDQSSKFADTVPGLINSAKRQWNVFGDFVDKYNLQPQIDQAVQGAKNNLSSFAANVGSGLLTGVGSLLAFIVNLVIVITMTFLMLLEGHRWIDGFWSLYKDKDREVRDRRLASRMYNVTTGYINGQVAVAAIGALFAGLATVVIGSIFHTPLNLAFPIIAVTFLVALIPMFGSTIAGTISALLLLLNSPVAGITYAVYFIIYQQIENNLIAPTVQAKTVGLSPLAIVLAITVGTYMLGIAGGIISIPIAGCIFILIDEYRRGNILAEEKAEAVEAHEPFLTRILKRFRRASEAVDETEE